MVDGGVKRSARLRSSTVIINIEFLIIVKVNCMQYSGTPQ